VTIHRALIVCSFSAATAFAAAAHAGDVAQGRSAYVVTRPDPGVVAPAAPLLTTNVPLRSGDSARVVVRPVVAPTLILDRAVSEQPVRPWLAEVRLANTTTIYVDPQANYRPHLTRGIDRNHTILKAQRLALSRMALPARVIRNHTLPVVDEQAARRDIRPRAIFRLIKPQPEGERKVAMAD
jgi:hypothetical protein